MRSGVFRRVKELSFDITQKVYKKYGTDFSNALKEIPGKNLNYGKIIISAIENMGVYIKSCTAEIIAEVIAKVMELEAK